MMRKVYVIGSINNDIVVNTARYPKPGETVHGTGLQQYPGGKGANQAVAAARAGAEAYMIGMVGDDEAGNRLRAFLHENHVDVDGIGTHRLQPTGTAIITVADNDNTIVVVAGANGELGSDSISQISFQKGDIVVAQFETPIETTRQVFMYAKEAGAQTVLNPAPAVEVASDLLDLVDALIVNEHEYEIVFGQPLPNTLMRKDIGFFAGIVIVTLGANGFKALINDTMIERTGIEVKVADTTGAGDCFVGYFAAGLAAALPAQKALEEANIAAALSVTKSGAAISIPFKREINNKGSVI